MSADQIVQTGPDTYRDLDGRTEFRAHGGQWHRFDVSYSLTSPCDEPGYGCDTLDAVVLRATGKPPAVVTQ